MAMQTVDFSIPTVQGKGLSGRIKKLINYIEISIVKRVGQYKVVNNGIKQYYQFILLSL